MNEVERLYDHYRALRQAARDQMSNFLLDHSSFTLQTVSAACRRADAAHDAYLKAKGESNA